MQTTSPPERGATAAVPGNSFYDVISEEKLTWFRRKKSERFQQAKPFPHLVMDDLFCPEMLEAVADEVAELAPDVWHSASSEHELKLSLEDETRFGPITRTVVHALNSGPFLSFLEKLTRIGGLIADPHLRGGGLHRIQRGGKLGIHADFNYYRRIGVYRRLNLLVYLNRDWKKAWGGHLELWDKARNECKRVMPVFNRAVIFETSPISYHGHPHPLECPEDESRRSLALYYYSVDYPYEDDLEPHTTIFYDTPSLSPPPTPTKRGDAS